MVVTTAPSAFDLLLHVFDVENLTVERARHALAVRFPTSDIDRMNVLAAKAREGALTELERKELDSYLSMGAVLGILHSKARKTLRDAGEAIEVAA